ncbi:alpha/beta hydrolase fold-domain-containing protein [Microdochium bolleyi]|uniref:Alpha/beta hydrolase fold-domain-containing protein n=1 Tax=Microdochium bolleyi TaxID=196109 RepID=A0A136J2Z5_9PEZI|nr:alpha/beta hydrolase fold-domain-containing protein [Microdochium bolleyi]
MSSSAINPAIVVPGAAHAFPYGTYLGFASWALRRLVASLSGDGSAFDKTIVIPTPGLGDGGVRASICLPKSNPAGKLPCVVVFEGGGFILGEPNDGQDMDRVMADEASSIVISLDYAKSPRYPFPHALLQGYEVLKWLQTDQPLKTLSVDIDTSRIALLGKSAGGNLASALSLLVSFTKGPCAKYRGDLGPDFRLSAQLLLYPSTSNNQLYRHRYAATDDAARAKSLPVWMAELMEYAYLPPGINAEQIFVAPNLATPELLAELAPNLPPCALFLAGLDCLKDEGRRYGQSLQAAGVHTKFLEYPEAIHGFPHYKPGQADYREEDVKSCTASIVRILNDGFRH